MYEFEKAGDVEAKTGYIVTGENSFYCHII
jgi:hypothetical protein